MAFACPWAWLAGLFTIALLLPLLPKPNMFANELRPVKDPTWKIYLSMEHFLAERVLIEEMHGSKISSFSKVPIYRGESASTGKRLDTKPVLLKLRIANVFRGVVIKLLAGSTP
jgi:hypothetical protein